MGLQYDEYAAQLRRLEREKEMMADYANPVWMCYILLGTGNDQPVGGVASVELLPTSRGKHQHRKANEVCMISPPTDEPRSNRSRRLP
jgi:hypothetical protein